MKENQQTQTGLLPETVLQAEDPDRAYLRWTMETDPPKPEDSLLLRGFEDAAL